MKKENIASFPLHIAIIMDGNGRWAKERGLPRTMGHRAGVEALKGIVRYSSEIGIEDLTVYAFSTENWSRPKEEIDYLLNVLLVEFLKKEIKELHKNKVKIRILGDIRPLNEKVKKEIKKAIDTTKENDGLRFNIALNYGGRVEIINAIKKINEALLRGDISLREIDEEVLEKNLYTYGIKDPDLIIRTSGEKRISNFLLWQGAYSELYFTDILWPDFNENHLLDAITEYHSRERRYGGLK